MADTAPFLKLTTEGAQKLVAAAAAKAAEIGQPQCITVVDTGGHMIAFLRMDGAFVQSIDSSMRKAMTSASYGTPTGHIPEGPDLRLAIATDGKRINLPGGLPIIGEPVQARSIRPPSMTRIPRSAAVVRNSRHESACQNSVRNVSPGITGPVIRAFAPAIRLAS